MNELRLHSSTQHFGGASHSVPRCGAHLQAAAGRCASARASLITGPQSQPTSYASPERSLNPHEWFAVSCAAIYLFDHCQSRFVDLPPHRGIVGRVDAFMAHCEIGDHSRIDDPMSASAAHCSSVITGCVSHRDLHIAHSHSPCPSQGRHVLCCIVRLACTVRAKRHDHVTHRRGPLTALITQTRYTVGQEDVGTKAS